MKTTIALSTIALTLSAFTTPLNPVNKNDMGNSTQTAQHLIKALKHSSISEYEMLFPKLDDFMWIMNQNASFYGDNLEEAKKEFAINYAQKVLPALYTSFEKIIAEGNDLGIDWQQAKFVRVEHEELSHAKFKTADLKIVFHVKGEEHDLFIKNALLIKGQWKMSKHVTLK